MFLNIAVLKWAVLMLTLQRFMITVLGLNVLQFNEQRKAETGEPVQGNTEEKTKYPGFEDKEHKTE